MHPWTVLLVTHVAAALTSVGLGVVQLVRRKGDARHRLLGRVWVVLLLWTAASSFWIRHLRDGAFSWLHVLSLVTLVTVTLGVVNIRRGAVRPTGATWSAAGSARPPRWSSPWRCRPGWCPRTPSTSRWEPSRPRPRSPP